MSPRFKPSHRTDSKLAEPFSVVQAEPGNKSAAQSLNAAGSFTSCCCFLPAWHCHQCVLVSRCTRSVCGARLHRTLVCIHAIHAASSLRGWLLSDGAAAKATAQAQLATRRSGLRKAFPASCSSTAVDRKHGQGGGLKHCVVTTWSRLSFSTRCRVVGNLASEDSALLALQQTAAPVVSSQTLVACDRRALL